MSGTNTCLLGLVATSLKPAALMFCTMRDANFTLNNYIGTPLEATSFSLPLSAMGITKSYLLGLVCTPLDLQFGFIRFLFAAIEEL
jgi:hypothetical protein